MVQKSEEAKLETIHWDRARFNRETQNTRTNIHPEHWPVDVRAVSQNGLTLLGLDRKGQLYLDGEQVFTVKRWGKQERAIAWVGVLAALIGASAACLSAYVDFASCYRVSQTQHRMDAKVAP